MLTGFSSIIRKFISYIAACCFFFGISTNASAALIGQDVFGTLNFNGDSLNLFDPANIGLPQGALNELSNPVTVSGSAFEFSHVINGINGIFVDFTNNGFTLTNDVAATPFSSWTMTFTSTAFVGLSLTGLSDSFNNGGISSEILGDTITLSWAGTDSGATLAIAEYNLQAVPLPGALALFLPGLAVMGLFGRRKNYV